MSLELQVSPIYANNPVSKILKCHFDFSRKSIIHLKNNGQVFLNGSPCKMNTLAKINDIIQVMDTISESSDNIIPEEIPLSILFEDDYLIALFKPPHQVVHPTFNHPSGTLCNGLAYYFLKNSIQTKIRPISRLDKDTSGVILFAKKNYIQNAIIKQMKTKTFVKSYLGILVGIVNPPVGMMNYPIKRCPDSLIKRVVDESGSPSITHYQVKKHYSTYSLVSFVLETGRTHQIRVHCSAVGHAILGDTLYGEPSHLISRQALHASENTFIHPITQKSISIKAPLPEDMDACLRDK